MQGCIFCGGDASEPNHRQHCDGRQGQIEAALLPLPLPPKLRVIRIVSPRETSVQAFYNAVDSGVIQTRREQVYAGLRAIGGGTSNETFAYVTQHHLGPRYISTVAARFTELRDMGVIREVGERLCRITGQMCLVWEVVPSAEYIGAATVRRCETCGQIVSRDVPVPVRSAAR